MTVRREIRGAEPRVVIDIPYRQNGRKRRYRRDAQVQTMAAARAEERRLLAELAETGEILVRTAAEPQQPAATERVTFAAATKRFFDVKGATSLKPSTRASYREIADGIVGPALDDLPLDSIEWNAVATLDAALAKAGSSPSRRRNVHVVIRSVLRFAVEAGLLAEFPKLPKLPRVPRKMLAVLTRADVERILDAAAPSARLAFALAAFAGLRAGEVRGLEWHDVDLRSRTLIVRRAISHGEVAAPKSGHERVVPLASRLVALLRDAHPNRANSERVALTRSGKPWGAWGLLQAFERAAGKVGIAGFRFHDLRHFFVTQLFRDGSPAPAVQALAGHHSLEVTQRYAHMVATDLRAAIASFDRFDRGNGVETNRTTTT